MTPRQFICTPSDWITDKTLNNLSDDAELLFRRLASATDTDWRFPVDDDAPEHTIRTLIFSPKRRFRAWSPLRVHRCLNELTAAGMLIRHFHGDRHWVEIGERWRYVRGRDPLGMLKEEQPDLGLPQELFVLEQPSPQPVKKAAKKSDSNQSRVEKSRSESSTPGRGSCEREGLEQPGGDNNTDPRDVLDYGEGYEVNQMIHHMIGVKDWKKNEPLWRMRLKENMPAMQRVLRDYLSFSPAEKPANRAAWATAKFYEYSPDSKPKKAS